MVAEHERDSFKRERARQIRRDYLRAKHEGTFESYVQLAKRYDITPAQIGVIIRGDSYGDAEPYPPKRRLQIIARRAWKVIRQNGGRMSIQDVANELAFDSAEVRCALALLSSIGAARYEGQTVCVEVD